MSGGSIDLAFDRNRSKQFPLCDLKYQELPQKNKQIIKKMLYLFVFYASKGSKHGYYQLQQHYFQMMMRDVIVGMELDEGRCQEMFRNLKIIYYSKGCQNNLSFNNFLELLPYLAMQFQEAKSQLSREESLKSFMLILQKACQQKVMPQIVGKVIQVEYIIDENSRDFLKRLQLSLTKLYKVYFPHQLLSIKIKNPKQKSTFKQKSLKSYLQMFQDFEVYPKLISARDIFYVFFQQCEKKIKEKKYKELELSQKSINRNKIVQYQLGESEKVWYFIQSLVVIARRVYCKLKQVDNEQQYQNTEQKIVIRTLLEYMQSVKTTSRRRTKFMNEKLCFILLDEHPQEILMKTIQIKDKVIKEKVTNLKFFNLMDKVTF